LPIPVRTPGAALIHLLSLRRVVVVVALHMELAPIFQLDRRPLFWSDR
jgi:hypothetical protein